MFIDRAKIFVKSGKGGDGSASFRREKYVPLGGPDGGDGGNGGSIIIVASSECTTLLDFKYKRKYVAEDGENGSGNKCYGKDGKDLCIKVPVGTIIKDYDSDKIMGDLAHKGDKLIVGKGGKGGKGNVKFATPTRQAPKFAEAGMPGEERFISLELKLLADVGLIGFPNVGKSTLLSVVSNAKPKIANYHFTTLEPNLGVVNVPGISSFVLADIPGIIEGASEGVGLGLEFLKHIERTRLLIHIVDISGIEGRNPIDDFIKINSELKNYSIDLSDRPQIVVANKCDLLLDEKVFEDFKRKVNQMGYNNVFKISAASNKGVTVLMKECARILSTIPVKVLEIPEDKKYIPEKKKFTYNIRKEGNCYIIEGSFVDRLLAAVDVNKPDSLRYFHKVLKNKGIIGELLQMGITDGDTVRMNDFEFDYIL